MWWYCVSDFPKRPITKQPGAFFDREREEEMIMNRGRVLLWLGLSVIIATMFVSSASAQFAETTGRIQGTVKDKTGGTVPNAKVELAGVAITAGRDLSTDAQGYFRFAQLPAGTYTINVTAPGFRKYVQTGIIVDVGRQVTLDVELEVGAVTETVEVSAAPVQIDVTSNAALVNIPSEEFSLEPKGRGVLGLMARAPGTRQEPLQGNGFQVDGASAGENNYTIEGQDTTQIRGGVAGIDPPNDFFKEITVKSSGYEAEHGGALGGAINLEVKSGGGRWHGAADFYYRSDALDASPRDIIRRDPTVQLSSLPPRFSEPVQVYRSIKDRYHILEPGFELGGPVWKDRIFLFTSYIPQLNKNTRTVNIKFVDPVTQKDLSGPRSYTQTSNTQFAVSRLDGRITNSLRAYALWNYAYKREEGTDRPNADDLSGEFNASATTDPRLRRPDRGSANPNVLWKLGADWTPTSKAVVAGSYGKWFIDGQDRGVPVGIRHIYDASTLDRSNPNPPPATLPFTGLDGSTIPSQFKHGAGFFDIPNNNQIFFDQYARTQANGDASYVFRALGTHTMKGGYSLNRLSNDVLSRTNTARVDLFWGQSLAVTAPFAAGCAPVVASNQSKGFGAVCQGNFGYWRITDFQTRGKVASNNQGVYIQDSWHMGRSLTANIGIRFENEYLPAYNAGQPGVISRPISFPFSNKVAPRIGAAYDVLHNGKLKIYGSWGWFYDIMKYELPRGSFGGEYWHNCVFTLDNPDYTQIIPGVKPGPFACNNGAVGQLPGTFLGEEDLRIPSDTPGTIAQTLDPGLRPIRQTEYTVGSEWALTKDTALEFRWAHKRLRNAIEDMGIIQATGEQFIIGNPGERIGQFPLRGDCAIPGPTPPRDPRCDSVLGISTLPAMPKARRDYDGLEFRINKRLTNWWLNGSYTWSRLFGNYSGLVNSDEQGRDDPNVSRAFDEQEIVWGTNGKPSYGNLATDRPHTFKASGGYSLKWRGMLTTIAGNLGWFIGTPKSTMIAFTDVDILVYAFGRGDFANIPQDPATGAWILGNVQHGARDPMYTNTDLALTHEFKLSKANEALRLQLQFHALNLFNKDGKLYISGSTDRNRFNDFYLFPDPTCSDPQGCASVSTIFRNKFFSGFDPIAAVNDPANGLGRLDSLYGTASNQTAHGGPQAFQGGRTLQFMVKVQF